MENNKKIYISGKITGKLYADAYEDFARAEKQWTDANYEVINPMNIAHDHDKSWENYMKVDLKAMLDCDSVYMLKCWKDSRGAIIEHNLAQELELKIIYEN